MKQKKIDVHAISTLNDAIYHTVHRWEVYQAIQKILELCAACEGQR